MHDFNPFRLKADQLDEAVLLEERLNFAHDICEAVDLEPQELLEMLLDLVEMDRTFAGTAHAEGPKSWLPTKRGRRAVELLKRVPKGSESFELRRNSILQARTGLKPATGPQNVVAQPPKEAPPSVHHLAQLQSQDIADRLGRETRQRRASVKFNS